MKSFFPIVRWFSMAGLAMLAGCASQSQTPVTNQLGVQSETEMKKPFMFGEARLPAGFPPPGPVGEVIIKNYPAARAAVVSTKTPGVQPDENRMFMPLFNHIKKNDIAMSAPVEMTRDEQSSNSSSMSFFYSDTTIGKLGMDENVEVVDVPAKTVISVGVRGSYSQAHFDQGLALLNTWLTLHPHQYKVTGPARMLGYNSPFVPWFLRYSEVQLPVTPVAAR